MKIRWTLPAAKDLEGIDAHLKDHHANLAGPTIRQISERIRGLKASPNRGRPGFRNGTRELVLTPLPYLVVYRVRAEAVEIPRIFHGAQNWRNM